MKTTSRHENCTRCGNMGTFLHCADPQIKIEGSRDQSLSFSLAMLRQLSCSASPPPPRNWFVGATTGWLPQHGLRTLDQIDTSLDAVQQPPVGPCCRVCQNTHRQLTQGGGGINAAQHVATNAKQSVLSCKTICTLLQRCPAANGMVLVAVVRRCL
jgi:hypothetical protein